VISRSRGIRKKTPLAALLFALVLTGSGCSYIFSEKRTFYQYEPVYGVASPEFLRSLEVLGTPMVEDNAAALCENGEACFGAMLAAIRGAQSSVNLEIYIFDHGEVATRFAEALAERARAGVEIRVLVDSWGSNLGNLQGLLTAAGAKVYEYKPLRIYSIFRVGNRTHRRILTVDGRIGFTGGIGIDDRWKGDARNPNEWRDTMVRVEGPVVAELQHIFLEDWLHTTGEVLHGDGQFPRVPPAGDQLAQAVASSRTDQSSIAKLAFYMAIQAARERIWIENAYFVPDRQIREGLLRAAARGVDVKIIVPGKYIDSPNVRLASRFRYGELLDGGVQIYEFQPTMMHNKVMVVDSIWASVGSINFVNRSMRKNAEVSVTVYDRPFAALVEQMVERDLARCDVLSKKAWKRRGLLPRIGELFFWLLSDNY
jgi:cardiolipin synthase A/B